jgi:hypothetical protein
MRGLVVKVGGPVECVGHQGIGTCSYRRVTLEHPVRKGSSSAECPVGQASKTVARLYEAQVQLPGCEREGNDHLFVRSGVGTMVQCLMRAGDGVQSRRLDGPLPFGLPDVAGGLVQRLGRDAIGSRQHFIVTTGSEWPSTCSMSSWSNTCRRRGSWRRGRPRGASMRRRRSGGVAEVGVGLFPGQAALWGERTERRRRCR